MKEYPIIFNTEMIKAILEGRKTQTRRIMPLTKNGCFTCSAVKADLDPNTYQKEVIEVEGKYGYKGDRLWVREAFKVEAFDSGYDNGVTEGGSQDYCAGGALVSYYTDNNVFKKSVDGEDWEPEEFHFNEKNIGKKRPSIHMPR